MHHHYRHHHLDLVGFQCEAIKLSQGKAKQGPKVAYLQVSVIILRYRVRFNVLV